MTSFRSPNAIRADFSSAMSHMYREEVPAYGQLMSLVADVNATALQGDAAAALNMTPEEDTSRISEERHGAIRLGTEAELAMMARVFAVMGMFPVGYYDLSVASVPVHSTAFRPIERSDLAENPFRVFTSLLRLELIEDENLRKTAQDTLERRQIFSDRAIELTEKAEQQGGLSHEDAQSFVTEILETFRWNIDACVSAETFAALIASHRLTADVVSFKGPHINHLTPRTLDIDAAQSEMVALGLPAKAVVEGPPPRKCPILLRQTAFKALDESIRFPDQTGGWVKGQHTARFGEIEQRGAALTPKGRALYDQLLAETRAKILPDANGENAQDYEATLRKTFEAFPDDWRALYDQGLAYFKISVNPEIEVPASRDVEDLLDAGVFLLSPIIYEDFLPVSAAGIFQSNLGDDARDNLQAQSSKEQFERALGGPVSDEFALYEAMQDAALQHSLASLQSSGLDQ